MSSTGTQSEMTFEAAFAHTRETLENLGTLPQEVSLPLPDTVDVVAVATIEGARAALEVIPRKHLITLTGRAVAARNNDGIDYLPEAEQRELIFTEALLLSMLDEAEQTQALG